MTGPVKSSEVFKDLLNVLEAIDPTSTATEVNMTKMREDSIKYVRDGAEKEWWTTWDDVELLIEEHDTDEEGAEEGMEAFSAEAYDDAGEDEDAEGDGGEEDSSDSEGGEDDGSQPSPDAEVINSDDETNYSQSSGENSDSDSDDGHGGGGDEGVAKEPTVEAPLIASEVSSGSQPSSEVLRTQDAREKAELDALQLLFDAAVRDRHDACVRFYRNRIAEKTRDATEGASGAGMLLRKRALEQQEEDEKNAKRYKEEEKKAAREERDQKQREQAQEEALRRETRLLSEQRFAQRKYEDEKRIAKFRVKEYQNWLQTKYPAELATRCITKFKDMDQATKKKWAANLKPRYETGEFQAFRVTPDLWKNDKTLTTFWAPSKSFHGGKCTKSALCGEPFRLVIDRFAAQGTIPVPEQMIMTLLEQCVPCARKIFTGNYTPIKMLHMQDYVIEKTFVYAMMMLTKFLGAQQLPWGVFKWPPAAPPDIYGSNPDILPAPDIVPAPVPVTGAASASGLSPQERLPPTPHHC